MCIRDSPKTEGEIRLAGLLEPVEIVRDVNGVAHIYALSLIHI